MNLWNLKQRANKPYSLLVNDTTLSSGNHLNFRRK